ncbi:integration host factor subunit alpha [Extensimonas vulgaris]|uniref:Integration host factor subunit alpha n=1 Tax=Extensimonas vulgaris TaxID=1031594 RepID=A0A369AJH9_9BURK|nr:integration host factor subunit alpha [Extensimonas vulgaris]RCX09559.1 integration host factor subunit alpha [Extensimonas vulgaris]TWI38689.1 integration host factor subunit alpha [Extensimonas vulgaris]TXD14468.1 integration host factor subunit alpha [Extensimonas vulgaris]
MIELTVENLETPALTKAQLAELLFDQIGLNKRESKEMVEAFFELLVQSLVKGEDVRLTGFGTFQVRTKASRPGRNPRTGELIPIKARRVVTFHASSKLKEQVQAAG